MKFSACLALPHAAPYAHHRLPLPMPIFRCPEFTVDTQARSVWRQSAASGPMQEVVLAPKLFDLLVLMLETPGTVVTRDQLLRRLWPKLVVSDETVTRTVSMLRKALGNDGHRLIHTVAKNGYRLDAQVVLVAAASMDNARPASNTIIELAPIVPAKAPDHAPIKSWRANWGAKHTAALTVGVLLCLLFSGGMILRRAPPAFTVLALASAPDNDSIKQWRVNAALAFLSDQLRDVPGLLIVRSRPGDDPLGANEASYVLQLTTEATPSAPVSGSMALTWSLRAAGSKKPLGLWRSSGDVTQAVQTARSELTRLLRLPDGAPKNITLLPNEALQSYATGLQSWQRGQLRDARNALNRALELAPNVAILHVDLADVISEQGYDDLARAHAKRALELIKADVLTESATLLRARAQIITGQSESAVSQLTQLAQVQPSVASVQLALLQSLAVANRYADLLGHSEQLLTNVTTTPALRARVLCSKALALLMLDRNDESMVTARMAINAAADLHEPVLAGYAQIALRNVLGRTGDTVGAIAAVKAAQQDFEQAGEASLVRRAAALQLFLRAAAGQIIDSALATRTLTQARASGNIAIERWMTGALIEHMFNQGEASSALQYALDRVQLENDRLNEPNRQFAQIRLASVLAYSGKLPDALVQLATLKPVNKMLTDPQYFNETSTELAFDAKASAPPQPLFASAEAANTAEAQWPCRVLRQSLLFDTLVNSDISRMLSRCEQDPHHEAFDDIVAIEAGVRLAGANTRALALLALTQRLEAVHAKPALPQEGADSLARAVLHLSTLANLDAAASARLSTLVTNTLSKSLLPLPRARLEVALASLSLRQGERNAAIRHAKAAMLTVPESYVRIWGQAQRLLAAAQSQAGAERNAHAVY
jgi:DNA-binding winged helix-turn-helix (wHTH) protein/tetratricopeptide (TPR) repeat protein